MNWKKHESSLLEALSDVGSTPTASTKPFIINKLYGMTRVRFRPRQLPLSPFGGERFFKKRASRSYV
jgi:hypothetical protein